MNITIYHPWIYLKGGAERVLIEYVKNSKYNVTILTSYYDKDNTFPEFQELNVERTRFSASVKRNFLSIFKSFISIFISNASNDTDILIISSEGLGDFFDYGGLLNNKYTRIAFCHTPLKIIYDDTTASRLKSHSTFLNYIIYSALSPIYRIINILIWANYTYIFCNSQETKNRIIRGKLKKKKLIEIAHPGVTFNKHTGVIADFKKSVCPQFILVAGRIMWQKNIELSIKSFAAFLHTNEYHGKLVIAGFLDEKSKKYYQTLVALTKDLSIEKKIEFIINPSDKELAELYMLADFVIFTPKNEDWGIVPIEAMAYGTPVLGVKRGGIAESVIDGETGVLVDNYSVESFAMGIERMFLIKKKQDIAERCKRRAGKFSWKNFAQSIDSWIENNVSTQI